MDPIPAARDRLTAVGHGPATGTGFAAEQEPHAVTRDRRESRAGVLLECETEVCRVELDGGGDVVDHVADANGRHGFAVLLFGPIGALALPFAATKDRDHRA